MEPSRPSATPLKAGTGTMVAGGGEPPYDGNMEHRITALEARWDAILPTLATKADVAELRAEMRDGLHQNAMATSELRIEMRQGFADVDTKMQKLSADNKSWMLATVLTIIGTMLAAILGISQIYKAAPPPVPIIITIPAALPVAK
jgi:chemotaxis regulatin CheY-phosphate phosphatase CheZ